ncbi:MAG: molybdopterin synthase catalytic subunit MoaE [Gammaproteobacteria bacterium]|nr:MAG: molybdopterin synthase catalytic subunit MoaE [Gammaproteobacteria bacterium]
MSSRLSSELIAPWEEINAYQQQMGREAKYGACSVFVGSMRDFNEGQDVQRMLLEHYPGMTDKFLEQLCLEATERWELLDTLLIHRVGEIRPNDTIVVIAVWSAHRKQAFEACRYLIEELKHRAPLWKKESLTGGDRWVEKNT